MWGNLILDSYKHNIFNTSFSDQKSNIMLYLLKWQYFWWFWFSYLFVLYYILFTNKLIKQLYKFNTQIVTTQKAHGKWGDVIICVLPIFWCVNILSNSNSLLKAVEWQTEANTLTVRVRGKQWYWLYKFDQKTFENINKTNITIGNGNKVVLQNNAQVDNDIIKRKNIFIYKDFIKKITSKSDFSNKIIKPLNYNICKIHFLKTDANFFYKNIDGGNCEPGLNTVNNLYAFFNKNNVNTCNSRSQVTGSFYNNIKTVSNLNGTYNKQNEPLFLKKNINSVASGKLVLLGSKNDININYKRSWYSIKQESLKNYKKYNWGFVTDSSKSNKYLLNNTLNTKKQHVFNLANNSRLLSVNNVLVLPTNSGITVITNSFDVVHSWFIPGLGIKMDCVPGRSTHHSLYISTPGFYYGQCAEICGRFHHHMPIKICALNFEHFFVWWCYFINNRYGNKIQ